MMKKTLALLLAVLMVLPMMVFTTAAEETAASTDAKIIPFATGGNLTLQGKYYYEACGYWAQDQADTDVRKTSYDAAEKALRVDITNPFSAAGTMMFKYQASSGYTYDLTDMKYLSFDLYVSDATVVAAMPMELELRAPGGSDSKEAVYRPSLRSLLGDTLVNGWNHFEIPLDVFGTTLTEDIRSQVNFMRLYNRGATVGYEGETLTMMMRNVYFSDTSLKVAPAQTVGDYYYLKHDNSVGQFTADNATAKMSFLTPTGVEKGLDLRTYEYLEMDIWIGHEALNNVVFTWEMNATGSYDGGQDTNGDGKFNSEGDEPRLHEEQFHETVEQASGTKLVAGEWTTVRVPLARWKNSNWDYANWRWFRMYSNEFKDESLGENTYAFRISTPRFVRYEENSLVYACEGTTMIHGEATGGWDVSLPSSGPANKIQTPWFDDIDGDGDKEWVLINVLPNDEDPASASGWFYSNGGWYSASVSDEEKALAEAHSGIKSGFTAYNGAFNRQNGSVKAIEFDLYLASGGVDADAAAGTAPTAEQATDSILDQIFNFNLGSQGDYANKITVNKQNTASLRGMFGSDLRLNDWNHVRLEVDSTQGKIYTTAGLDFDQFAYFRLYNASKFGYYNGLTIAIDDFRVICDYGEEEEPETVTPGGQSEVLTLNTGTGGYGTNGNDKGAPYAGHTNAYAAYQGASVTDATKSEKALYFDYFFPNTIKSDPDAGTKWSSRNTFNFASAVDVSTYDTVCFELYWDVDPDASADFLNFLLNPSSGWNFEIRSTLNSDTAELQWAGSLNKFIPGVTADMLREPGCFNVELTFASATNANFVYTNAVQLGAFVQNTDITVGPNNGAALWIDNVYFKDSTYVAPDVEPEPETPVVVDYLSMSAIPTLNDTFNLDFQVKLLDGMNTSVTPVVDLTYDGAPVRMTPVDKDGTTVYPFHDIFAHRMADKISLRTFVVDGKGAMVWEDSTYSIQDYCARKLADAESSDALKALLSATLRYGAAAQTYAAYNEGNLATNGVTGMTDAPAFVKPTSELQVLSRDYNAGTDAYKWRGATLVLGSAMALRYSFRADSVEGLTVTYTNGSKTGTVNAFTKATDAVGDYYYFDVPVFATEFDSVFTVSFDGLDGTDGYDMSYSVNHYVATKYNPELKKTAALLETIYHYGVAADAYVAQ